MMRWMMILACIGLPFSAMAKTAPKKAVTQTQTYYIAKNIDHLEVDGPMVLKISSQNSDDHLHISLPHKDLATFTVHQRTLHIHASKMTPIKMEVAHLSSLLVDGEASVYAKDIELNHVKLASMQSAPVKIERVEGLHTVFNEGTGDFQVLFIEPEHIAFDLRGHSVTKVSGLGKHMSLRISEDAMFDGMFFRMENVWVHAYGSAIAKVQPLKLLHAYAEGASQVGYYNHVYGDQIFKKTLDHANIVYVSPLQYMVD